MPKAEEAQSFLRRLTRLCAKENEALRWTTPLGFPVINRYHQPIIERIPVYPNGRRREFSLAVGDKDDIYKSKCANSVAANFVHSMDACYLQLVALAVAEEGFELVTVHDCFGCLAPRAGRLNLILKEQLRGLYKGHDVLAEVLASARKILPGVKLPSPPERGNLNIDDVVKANPFK